MKKCASCRRVLDRSAFRPSETLRDGLQSWCRECYLAATRAWRARNPDYIAAYNASRRAPTVERRCWCGATFRTARRSTSRCEAHRDVGAPELRRRQAARRRAALGPAPGRIGLAAVYERDGGRCWICERPVSRDRRLPDPLSPSIDHVVPLSRGGPHVLENLRLAHLGCNVRRGARLPVAPRPGEIRLYRPDPR